MGLRVAFAGAGGIANRHMRNLASLEDVEMVGFYDPDRQRAETAAAAYGGLTGDSLSDLCDRAAPQALYVCVPPFAHGDTEREAIARGLHLFVEKPVSASLTTARQIRDDIEARGLVAAVGYHWRCMDTTLRARQLLGDIPVGFALGGWMGGLPGVAWWRVMAQSGGQIVEQTTHIFDLARHLLGEVRQVHAMARTGLLADVEGYDVHDATVTNLAFASGAIASLTSSCLLQAGGQVGLDLYQAEQVLRLKHRQLVVDRADGSETFELRNEPTVDEDRAFVAAALAADPAAVVCDYGDAVRTLSVTLAATRSAQEGRVIDVESE
jgi:predicted dehydrogenase